MHALRRDGWTMNFNSDMSGMIEFTQAGSGVAHVVPGELVRAYVAEYVLPDLIKKLADLILTAER